jgi:hypothetical protein
MTGGEPGKGGREPASQTLLQTVFLSSREFGKDFTGVVQYGESHNTYKKALTRTDVIEVVSLCATRE